jgi:hypothetical protein
VLSVLLELLTLEEVEEEDPEKEVAVMVVPESL